MVKYFDAVKKSFELPEIRVDDSHSFWLKRYGGDVVYVCHSIKELKGALKEFPETLEYHENSEFADWVEKVFGRKTLARKIRIAPKRKISRIL